VYPVCARLPFLPSPLPSSLFTPPTSASSTADEEAIQLLHLAANARETAPTAKNDNSSRSHALFSLTFTVSRPGEGGVMEVVKSTLRLVDLAGEGQA
jgi:hypothetical protein